jgi:hypothetical protein
MIGSALQYNPGDAHVGIMRQCQVYIFDAFIVGELFSVSMEKKGRGPAFSSHFDIFPPYSATSADGFDKGFLGSEPCGQVQLGSLAGHAICAFRFGINPPDESRAEALQNLLNPARINNVNSVTDHHRITLPG